MGLNARPLRQSAPVADPISGEVAATRPTAPTSVRPSTSRSAGRDRGQPSSVCPSLPCIDSVRQVLLTGLCCRISIELTRL